MPERTFLVAYAFQTDRGVSGSGRCFVTTNKKTSRAWVEDTERQLRENNSFSSVAVTNVVLLEA